MCVNLNNPMFIPPFTDSGGNPVERVYHSPGDPEQNKKRRVDKTPRFFVAYTVVFCFIRPYSFVYVRIYFIRPYSTVYASIRFFTCFQSFKIGRFFT